MGKALSVECCTSRHDSFEKHQLGRQLTGDSIWYDCDEFHGDLHQPSAVLEAGVPTEAAEGVASLAEMIGASGMEPLCDPLTLLRFYISCEGNAALAADMYWSFSTWRSEFSIGLVMAMHGSGETYCCDGSLPQSHERNEWQWKRNPVSSPEAALADRCGFWGRLKDPMNGGPIMVWRVGTADIAAVRREGLLDALRRALAAHVEDCFQLARAASIRKKQLVLSPLVIDAEGISVAFLRNLGLIVELLKFFLNYPEQLSSVTVIRAPWMATQIFQAAKPFIHKNTSAKFAILGNDFARGLKEHSGVDVAVLPECLGGHANDKLICAHQKVPIGAGDALRETQGRCPGFPAWFSRN